MHGLELLNTAVAQEAKGKNFLEWVLSLNLKLKKRNFTFKGFEELEAIYKDNHPDMVFRKGVQIGISTYVVLRVLHRAAKEGMKGIYYLPTKDFAKEFTPDRINPIIKQIPEIHDSLTKDDTHLKQFLNTALYIIGLRTREGVASIDADTLVFDEFDLANKEIQEEAKDRLERSTAPEIYCLSKPSIPGYGIDREFLTTDQHFRLMTCPNCGFENDVIEHFPENLFPQKTNNEKGFLGCIRCRTKLNPRRARWVAKNPGATRRGYHLSSLYWTWKPPRYSSSGDKAYQLLRAADKVSKVRRVYQSIAGIGYAGDLAPITDAVLNQCHGTHDMRPFSSHSYLGFDQGDDIWIVAGEPEGDDIRIIWIEKTQKFPRVYDLMRSLNVWCAVGDAMPNKHSAKDWALAFLGYAYIQYFHKTQTSGTSIGKEDKNGVDIPKVTIDRTESLDQTNAEVISGRFILPSRNGSPIVDEFRKHLKHLTKEKKTDGNGDEIMVFKKSVPNHLGMALNNMRIAATLPAVRPYGYGTMPFAVYHGENNHAH